MTYINIGIYLLFLEQCSRRYIIILGTTQANIIYPRRRNVTPLVLKDMFTG